MKTKKMSLANIQGKLSRAEMKNIMAGSGTGCQGLSFTSCMQCAIAECSADWRCYILCGVNAELCLATYTVTCAI